jgi:nicotinamidase-related amidase
MPKQAIKYLQDLEAQKEFPHLIWPEHCIVGSYGAAIDSNLMDVAIIPWARNGKFYQIVQKGQYPLAEHFGAFRANVEVVNQPSTQVNQPLINVLSNYDEIYFSGEAKTHCVANTLKQALDYPTLAAKFIVLTDCMSSVPGYDNLSDPIYADATAKGVRFAKSTDITL